MRFVSKVKNDINMRKEVTFGEKEFANEFEDATVETVASGEYSGVDGGALRLW